jgi:peptidoglycan/xylan/chitin deacetylase (PgdA/CDA1 family)
MYHRVSEKFAGVEAPTNNVTPKRFRMQLEGLLARGFEPWPLQRLLAASAAGEPIPRGAIAVTFDDGYENNLHSALPVLEDLRVPATIFLATAFLDTHRAMSSDNWSCAGSDRVPATSWRALNTGQCRQLLDSGWIELGAHTHTHRFFLGRADEFRRDLTTNVEILRERFGIEHPSFAFPFGMTSSELVDAARAVGVCCALTTRSDRVRPGDDPYAWGRFSADDSDTPATLAAKLRGWYAPVAAALRGVKHPLRTLMGGGAGRTAVPQKRPHSAAHDCDVPAAPLSASAAGAPQSE